MKEQRIGVISDTHYPIPNFPFEQIKQHFKEVDLIIHAGDLTTLEIIKQLSLIAPVEVVCGNMDTLEVCKQIPKKKMINFAQKKIGIIHGTGSPTDFPENLSNIFNGERPDILVFGHTHIPSNKYIDGILCFNPGSPIKPHFVSNPSVGIIEISPSGEIISKIIELL